MNVDPYRVKKGDKVAQMVFMKVEEVKFEVVESKDLSDTERGEGGFNSTGHMV